MRVFDSWKHLLKHSRNRKEISITGIITYAIIGGKKNFSYVGETAAVNTDRHNETAENNTCLVKCSKRASYNSVTALHSILS